MDTLNSSEEEMDPLSIKVKSLLISDSILLTAQSEFTKLLHNNSSFKTESIDSESERSLPEVVVTPDVFLKSSKACSLKYLNKTETSTGNLLSKKEYFDHSFVSNSKLLTEMCIKDSFVPQPLTLLNANEVSAGNYPISHKNIDTGNMSIHKHVYQNELAQTLSPSPTLYPVYNNSTGKILRTEDRTSCSQVINLSSKNASTSEVFKLNTSKSDNFVNGLESENFKHSEDNASFGLSLPSLPSITTVSALEWDNGADIGYTATECFQAIKDAHQNDLLNSSTILPPLGKRATYISTVESPVIENKNSTIVEDGKPFSNAHPKNSNSYLNNICLNPHLIKEESLCSPLLFIYSSEDKTKSKTQTHISEKNFVEDSNMEINPHIRWYPVETRPIDQNVKNVSTQTTASLFLSGNNNILPTEPKMCRTFEDESLQLKETESYEGVRNCLFFFDSTSALKQSDEQDISGDNILSSDLIDERFSGHKFLSKNVDCQLLTSDDDNHNKPDAVAGRLELVKFKTSESQSYCVLCQADNPKKSAWAGMSSISPIPNLEAHGGSGEEVTSNTSPDWVQDNAKKTCRNFNEKKNISLSSKAVAFSNKLLSGLSNASSISCTSNSSCLAAVDKVDRPHNHLLTSKLPSPEMNGILYKIPFRQKQFSQDIFYPNKSSNMCAKHDLQSSYESTTDEVVNWLSTHVDQLHKTSRFHFDCYKKSKRDWDNIYENYINRSNFSFCLFSKGCFCFKENFLQKAYSVHHSSAGSKVFKEDKLCISGNFDKWKKRKIHDHCSHLRSGNRNLTRTRNCKINKIDNAKTQKNNFANYRRLMKKIYSERLKIEVLKGHVSYKRNEYLF